MSNRVLIVGVNADGPQSLTPAVLTKIAQADVLWGSDRLLQYFQDNQIEKVYIRRDVDALVKKLLVDRGEKKHVILASGDPGFFGIAEVVLRYLPSAEVEIIPNVSSLQLAFSRAGICWSDAVFTSAHAKPLSEAIGWAKRSAKVGILTDQMHTPAVIAKSMLAAGVNDCRAIVAENLGLPEEKIIHTRLSALPMLSFAPLCVLLLVHENGWCATSTNTTRPDAAYTHRNGLITKADIRSLILARLQLIDSDIVWDIGAGSGAVSIEMAESAWRGKVYAIEMDTENIDYIQENIARYGVQNVEVIAGRAPLILHELPAPNAVFIGGSGGEMIPILEYIALAAKPGCRLVISFATLENLQAALTWMHKCCWQPLLTQVSVAQGKAIAGLTRLEAQNPIFIIAATVS